MLFSLLNDLKSNLSKSDIELEPFDKVLLDEINKYLETNKGSASSRSYVRAATPNPKPDENDLTFIAGLFIRRHETITRTLFDYTESSYSVNDAWVQFALSIQRKYRTLSYVNFIFPKVSNTMEPNGFSKLSSIHSPLDFYPSDDGATLFSTNVLLARLEKGEQFSTYRPEKKC
jgi:hypothetical protein